MKAYLLTALLTINTDTVPYIHNGYYEADTVLTLQQYRVQNKKIAKQLKDAEHHSTITLAVGFILGALLVGGAFGALRP